MIKAHIERMTDSEIPLIVDPTYDKQGVAKKFIEQTLIVCLENKFDFTEITVNSSSR